MTNDSEWRIEFRVYRETWLSPFYLEVIHPNSKERESVDEPKDEELFSISSLEERY